MTGPLSSSDPAGLFAEESGKYEPILTFSHGDPECWVGVGIGVGVAMGLAIGVGLAAQKRRVIHRSAPETDLLLFLRARIAHH